MPQRKSQFVAEIPWIGPRLGHRSPSDSAYVPIVGALSPLFADAFSAALIPVLRDRKVGSGKFLPVDRRGACRRVSEVAQLVPVESDGYGWFVMQARVSWWEKVDGVLVALLYDTSPELGDGSFGDYPDVRVDWQEASLDATRAGVVRRARKSRMSKAIADALEELLTMHAVSELELGVVELKNSIAGSDRFSRSSGLCFALGSCQYPAGMLNDEVAGASYRRLAARLDSPSKDDAPQFLVLAGDQIYVDSTAGMFDPTKRFDRFVQPYSAFFRMRAVRDVLRRLPAYSMMDDHEIEDNWEPVVWMGKPDPNLDISRELYLKFQRAGGPPQQKPIGDSRAPLWYTFEVDGFPFFIGDTRTERTPRTAASIEQARIMSDAQFEHLLRWLDDQEDDLPKFVVTPAMLLPRRLRAIQHGHPASALRSDAWDGYPHSLQHLLAYIAQRNIRNVIFLSGDEHLSCVAEAHIAVAGKRRSVPILSIHASALYAPFPFANSRCEDFAASETFEFRLSDQDRLNRACLAGEYQCTVQTRFAPPGDGFAIVRAFRERDSWVTRIDFDRAGTIATQSITARD